VKHLIFNILLVMLFIGGLNSAAAGDERNEGVDKRIESTFDTVDRVLSNKQFTNDTHYRRCAAVSACMRLFGNSCSIKRPVSTLLNYF
jgi:hypothetical protein